MVAVPAVGVPAVGVRPADKTKNRKNGKDGTVFADLAANLFGITPLRAADCA